MEGEGHPRGGTRGPGCLAAGLRLAALAVVGPLVALRRWRRRRRRGNEVRVTVGRRSLGREGGVPLERLDLMVDLPPEGERAARRELTALVVRVAEALRLGDDSYHLVYRCPWEEEASLKAVGPAVQALGERLHQHLGRSELEGATSVWLVLPRSVYLASVVDQLGYDPAREGEPDGLFSTAPCRWGFAAAWTRREASVMFRLALYLPPDAAATATPLLESFRTRLAAVPVQGPPTAARRG